MGSVKQTRRILKWVGNALLAVMLVWTLTPFYWMVATSLKKDKEIYGFEATLIPRQPNLDAYRRLLAQTPFVLYLRNGTVVAVSTTVASLVFGCLGAYALARLRFRGRALIARGLIFTYLVPQSLLFIPLFAVMSTLALTDTLKGLTLAYLGFTLPFCTWLLLGYFRSVPLELEEAALVDGCSRLGALVRVILPMSLPALAVVAFFSFTQAWNEFLYANVFVNSVEARTITTGLTLFVVEDVFFWGTDDGGGMPGHRAARRGVPGLPAVGRQGADARRGEGLTQRRERWQSRRRPGGKCSRRRAWRRASRRRRGGSSSRATRSGRRRSSSGTCRTSPLADELQKQQVYEFAKQAGVKESEVEYATVANEQFDAKLAAALEAGNPPDVTRLYESNVQYYAAGNHLLDVNDVVEKMRREPQGIFESSMAAVLYKGRAMGVPLAVNPWPVHARLDLLEQAKVEYPKTWDEFIETSKKIQSPPRLFAFGMCLGLVADTTDNVMEPPVVLRRQDGARRQQDGRDELGPRTWPA